jgi:hypothetical protein
MRAVVKDINDRAQWVEDVLEEIEKWDWSLDPSGPKLKN